ncbi:MAG: transporter substrate-binding domain-containing protein [Bacillota bacterium]|nr:transporter substrate-binding domain-containing protein [Bacillota bacterium]MDW7683571.1 transporter substrate-binding domain-containing protein [Bacillota bacterium]
MKKFGKLFAVSLLILVMVFVLVGCGGSDGNVNNGNDGNTNDNGQEAVTEVRRFETTPMALLELINSGVDAVVADSPVVLEFIKENPNSGLKAFGDDNFEKEFYGMAMRQEDTDTHAMINEGLSKIRANGVYDKIFNKYFGDGADYEVAESENTLGITLNVAQDMAYAPFESINEDGEPEGFDVDLIRAIAAEMGFAVNLINTNWDGIIPSLTGGNSDLIISAMTITEERSKSVTFSDPYFEATQFIAVQEGSDIASLADLEGKKIGVQNQTTGDIAVTEFFNLD